MDNKGKTQSIGIRLLENRRYRVYASLVIAVVVFFFVYQRFALVISFMLTWIAFATSNLVAAWIIISSCNPQDVKAIADKEDSSGAIIFLFVLIAALISLVAIIFLLLSIPNGSKHGLSAHILLAFTSVFCSWTLVHTLFTLRYAHLFYLSEAQSESEGKQHIPALSFPNEDDPDYLDFAYFSFVLGMTFQVSDVTINSKKLRRMALLHGFLSFVYNTVIVALSINIISGMISK